MASNLNKAFMRAYAKDRSASTEEANAVAPPSASTTAAVTAVTAAATLTAQPSPVGVPAPGVAIAPNPTPNTLRVSAGAQPSMEPTLFAGRYVQPAAPVAQPKAPVAQSQTSVLQTPTKPANRAASNPPDNHNPAEPTAPIVNTHRNAAPSIQASGPQPRPTPTRTSQSVAQPRVISGTSAQRPAQPQPTRLEKVDESDPGGASRVWQRIDAAHGTGATHPTETQARPSVTVGVIRTAAPKRMQAAAAPAQVAPAPVTAPGMRIDSPAPAGTRQLPLVGDEGSAQPEPQQAETRRRTVADFLYSAGQYNPGRVLASAEPVDLAMAANSATTIPSASAMRTSEMVRPMDRPMDRSAGRSIDGSSSSQPTINSLQTSEHTAASSQSFAPPVIDEPIPRRMGQILRVDVPRNHGTATTMPVPMPVPMAEPMAAPASMPVQPMSSQNVSSQNVSSQSVSSQFVQAAAPTVASVDAPVAKYVLEQRRIDRAHKLNEAEEKLRHMTHKVFNPIWEVDNLQWPVVVDKLMQQRAQSMSHVAEHLKTACQDGLSVLGVTSADQSEGRTTVACCLARLAAAHGLKVALVDIDLDHPTLCIQTNMEVEHDWRDCLSEDVALEEVAVHSIDDQLTMLPLKPRGGRPGLLASDSRIADILTDLSECFELVIVDCAKINSSGNVITGLAHTKIFDAAIVVVDRRDGQADRVEDAVRMIQQTGIESIGIVDNFSM